LRNTKPALTCLCWCRCLCCWGRAAQLPTGCAVRFTPPGAKAVFGWWKTGFQWVDCPDWIIARVRNPGQAGKNPRNEEGGREWIKVGGTSMCICRLRKPMSKGRECKRTEKELMLWPEDLPGIWESPERASMRVDSAHGKEAGRDLSL
jgi:hypothetical protein